VRRRQPAADRLPRWIRAPLAADWLTPEELGEPLALYTALCRYLEGVCLWCEPRRLDWHHIEQGYPLMPEQAGGTGTADPPPPQLLSAVLAGERTARERAGRWESADDWPADDERPISSDRR
jgi:hypothetical protein